MIFSIEPLKMQGSLNRGNDKGHECEHMVQHISLTRALLADNQTPVGSVFINAAILDRLRIAAFSFLQRETVTLRDGNGLFIDKKHLLVVTHTSSSRSQCMKNGLTYLPVILSVSSYPSARK
jgi:hypothetical protein